MPHKRIGDRKSYQAEWYDRNKETIAVRHKAQRALDREGANARQRKASARHRHGPHIEEDWAAMWVAQEGNCYLCGDPLVEGNVHVDHDHRCCPHTHSCRNCRRGLACNRCNQAIGLANDSPERLRRMADGLEVAQQRVAERKPDEEQLSLLPLDPEVPEAS